MNPISAKRDRGEIFRSLVTGLWRIKSLTRLWLLESISFHQANKETPNKTLVSVETTNASRANPSASYRKHPTTSSSPPSWLETISPYLLLRHPVSLHHGHCGLSTPHSVLLSLSVFPLDQRHWFKVSGMLQALWLSLLLWWVSCTSLSS